MNIGDKIEYKGFQTTVEFSLEDNVYFGRIENIRDFVNWESDVLEHCGEEFENAVEDYLIFLKECNDKIL